MKVNLGDGAVIKHVFDEHAARLLCSSGYTEDVTFSNIKLLLGVVAVAICAAANLLAGPFPQSLTFVKYCVVVYFTIHIALQLMHLLLPPNTILITHTRPRLPPSQQSLDPVQQRQALSRTKLTTPPLVLTSHMARYTTVYELTLGVRQGRELAVGGLVVSRAMEVTDFFDMDGVFLKDKYEARVKEMVDEVERRELQRLGTSKTKAT